MLSRIAKETSLVELITLLACSVMWVMLDRERKERIEVSRMLYQSQKDGIALAEKSLDTTSKLTSVLQSLKERIDIKERVER